MVGTGGLGRVGGADGGESMTPKFKVGDFALRPRVQWTRAGIRARAEVVGLEVVEIVGVRAGGWVRWTNHRRGRNGERFTHPCEAAELLPLSALEHLRAPDEKSAVNSLLAGAGAR